MRVLHVVASSQRRGAETFAADLIRTLEREGTSQSVVLLRPGPGEIDFGVPTRSIDPVSVAGRTRRVPGIRIDRSVATVLRRAVHAEDPDVVQAHGGEALKHAVASDLRTKTPVVYRRIGMAPLWIRRGARRRAHGWLVRQAASVIAVSESVRTESVALFGLETDRVITIPNAVDPERIKPTRGRRALRKSLGVEAGEAIVLSLGSLGWEKDPLAHLEATSRALSAGARIVHLFAGDGPMRTALETEVERRGLSGTVRLLGVRHDVGDLLAAGDLLLFASRADGMEGMPAQVIEAGMAGLPVVGYATAGVPEVVVNGTTGILVAQGDVDALARGIVRVSSDGPTRRAMGAAARARCARYDIDTIAPQYLEVYRSVATARPAARVGSKELS